MKRPEEPLNLGKGRGLRFAVSGCLLAMRLALYGPA